MKMTDHFTMEEFVFSENASRFNIDNSLPKELYPTALKTLQMMEVIRHYLGDKSIVVTSGYRSPKVNQLVGSKSSSDHIQAMAVDWKCPEYGTPFAVAAILSTVVDMLGIGQLIYEFRSWVHTSIRVPNNPVNRVLTIDADGTQTGIHP